jgi:hypothetical protein
VFGVDGKLEFSGGAMVGMLETPPADSVVPTWPITPGAVDPTDVT